MATHLARESADRYTVRTYCGREMMDAGGVEWSPEHVTCRTCRRAMVRDWCPQCFRLLVAWDEEECLCKYLRPEVTT